MIIAILFGQVSATTAVDTSTNATVTNVSSNQTLSIGATHVFYRLTNISANIQIDWAAAGGYTIVDGSELTIAFENDVVLLRVITWGSNFKTLLATLTGTASKIALATFKYSNGQFIQQSITLAL